MPSLLFFLAWGWLFIVLQLSLFAFLPLGEARPDLLYFLVFFLAIERGNLSGAVLVFFLGYLLDISSSAFFGTNALLALVLYFSVNFLSQRLEPREPPFWALGLAIFSVFEITFLWLWQWLLNPGSDLPPGFLSALLLRILGNLAFGIPTLKLLFRVETWRKKESSPHL